MSKKTLDWSRRGITEAIRKEVLGEDPYWWAPCFYCGYKATEVDHVVPRSRGGGLDPENLVAACFECNREKLDLTPDEWAAARLSEGKPWPISDWWDRACQVIQSEVISTFGYIPIAAVNEKSQEILLKYLRQNFEHFRAEIVRLRDVPWEVSVV